LKEGVPVKGELEKDGGVMNRDEMAAADQMSGDAARPVDGAPRGRRAGARAMNYERPQAALSPADEQLARVFGLVLGSPEFQRK
jgi:hypothetical protein